MLRAGAARPCWADYTGVKLIQGPQGQAEEALATAARVGNGTGSKSSVLLVAQSFGRKGRGGGQRVTQEGDPECIIGKQAVIFCVLQERQPCYNVPIPQQHRSPYRCQRAVPLLPISLGRGT